jgi:hypothetical protein
VQLDPGAKTPLPKEPNFKLIKPRTITITLTLTTAAAGDIELQKQHIKIIDDQKTSNTN